MDIYRTTLQRNGLAATHLEIVVSGGLQHRYTLRSLETGLMIAWFCWFVKPANPYRERPEEVGIVEIQTKHAIPEAQSRAAREWLARLRTRHPVHI